MYYLLSIFSLVNLKVLEKFDFNKKRTTKLIKSISMMKSPNPFTTNLIMRDLARVRKICQVFYHTAAPIKLQILTYYKGII